MNEKTKDYLAYLLPKDREIIRGSTLDRLSLKNKKLTHLDFSDISAVGTNFQGSNISHSIFSRCDLSKANLSNCISEGSVFVDAKFEGVICEETKFDHSWMIRTAFIRTRATSASFVRVDFTGSIFLDNDFSSCNFDECNLNSVTGLSQSKMLKKFLDSLDRTNFHGEYICWRTLRKNRQSLCGETKEMPGDIIEVKRNIVSLDERAGCDVGLHVCRTKEIAQEFGKRHLKEYLIVPVIIKRDWLLVVHLSNDFGRVYKYKNAEKK